MSFIHFCIDMQVHEGRRFFPNDWDILRQNIITLKTDLSEFDVPTLNIAMIEKAQHVVKPIIGCFRDVQQQLLSQGIDLHDRNYGLGFDIPIDDDEMVAIKRRFSALTAEPIRQLLAAQGHATVILSGVWEAWCEEGTFDHDSCINQTAYALKKSKHNVIIARDGTDFFHDTSCLKPPLAQRSQFYKKRDIQEMPIRDIIALVQSQKSQQAIT